MDMPNGTSRKHQLLAVTLVIFAAVAVGAVVLLGARQTLQMLAVRGPTPAPPQAKSTETPNFKVETVVGGLEQPWDIAFLPDGQALVTDRPGTLYSLKDSALTPIATIADIYSREEGGLLGLAIDPNFTDNHHIYTCFNTAKITGNNTAGAKDIRVVRWRLNGGKLEDRQDIITGMPTSQGRHSGCRLAFGPDSHLWVTTGDSANSTTAQDHKSLGGKILRVDRDGKPAPDNLGGDFDPRIYSYGHRNTQGIAFLPKPLKGVIGYSTEHGPIKDDEINPLTKGNFGWAPAAYDAINENATPMTDKNKFPDAIDAIWSSGEPTQAPAGATFIKGHQWKAWDGALAIAMLKGSHLKVLQIDNTGHVAKEEKVLTDKGRLRAITQASDGSLYVTTANASDNQILRLIAE